MIKTAIRHYRELANLTQQQLADFVLCSVDTVRRWEAGTREPRAGEIAKLAAALHVTEAELLNGPQENKIRLEIIFDKMEQGQEEVLDMSSNGSAFNVFLGADGTIGLRGGAKFSSTQEIEDFFTRSMEQVKAAFAWQVERGAIRPAGA